jgi:hypothetical protein
MSRHLTGYAFFTVPIGNVYPSTKGYVELLQTTTYMYTVLPQNVAHHILVPLSGMDEPAKSRQNVQLTTVWLQALMCISEVMC